ncbi:MAG: aspartyl/asparaginyl beta-hydroxylase domain-containing protein [Marinomonas sp.]
MKKSQIIGKLNLDQSKLVNEIKNLNNSSKISEEYDEFSSGYWENLTLWNHNGNDENTEYSNFSGSAKKTKKTKEYPYINSLINKNFKVENLKMARIRMLSDAVLIPHKDFVELDRNQSYIRVFIPLNDAKQSFHCEENFVFRMRPGEIWHLNAESIHNAINFSPKRRISLCLDFAFDYEVTSLKEIFSEEGNILSNSNYEIEEIIRPNLDKKQINSLIFGVSQIINKYNFKELVFVLSKINFMYNIPANDFYDILLDICNRSKNNDLIKKAYNLKRYMIEKREFKERFEI